MIVRILSSVVCIPFTPSSLYTHTHTWHSNTFTDTEDAKNSVTQLSPHFNLPSPCFLFLLVPSILLPITTLSLQTGEQSVWWWHPYLKMPWQLPAYFLTTRIIILIAFKGAVSSLRCELSATGMLMWPGSNHVHITCKTCHVTWYKETAQPLSFTEVQLHVF